MRPTRELSKVMHGRALADRRAAAKVIRPSDSFGSDFIRTSELECAHAATRSQAPAQQGIAAPIT
jgi:hypothetical protein